MLGFRVWIKDGRDTVSWRNVAEVIVRAGECLLISDIHDDVADLLLNDFVALEMAPETMIALAFREGDLWRDSRS